MRGGEEEIRDATVGRAEMKWKSRKQNERRRRSKGREDGDDMVLQMEMEIYHRVKTCQSDIFSVCKHELT